MKSVQKTSVNHFGPLVWLHIMTLGPEKTGKPFTFSHFGSLNCLCGTGQIILQVFGSQRFG